MAATPRCPWDSEGTTKKRHAIGAMIVMRRISTIPTLVVLFSSLGCPAVPDAPEADVVGGSDDGIPGNDATSGPTTVSTDGSGDEGDDAGDDGFPSLCDFTGDEPGDPCLAGNCHQIDILFVVDNSASMGTPQRLLSASLPLLYDKLQALVDGDGNPLNPDVNIMFTTTDVGHPLCTAPDGYAPALGAPQAESCTERIDEFIDTPESCTDGCAMEGGAVGPIDPFIHFDGPMGTSTNVPGNAIANAMRCLAPQGIVGCGYEAPLESMLLAIDPAATWNLGNKPFVRDQARLAVVFITDEEDCSVRAPEGYAYFTDPSQNTYWEEDPATGAKTQASSAVCWNSGVDCGAPDANGVYADCHAIDNGVLHPIDRYLTYLRDEVIGDQNKEVVMLGILGVPTVTKRSPELPYQPIDGGIDDLVYAQSPDPNSEFEFGIGPGCTSEDGSYPAIPPVRLAEVCEGLDDETRIRCIIESVCDPSYDDAFVGLAGLIQTIVLPE